MSFLEDFICSLFPNYKIERAFENDLSFEVDLSASNYVAKEIDYVSRALSFIQVNDILVCTVNFGDAEPISYYSSKDNTEEFVEKLNEEYTHQEGEQISIKINISKVVVNRICNVYDIDTFVESLKNLSISQFLTVFTRAFLGTTFVIFRVIGAKVSINTATIFFTDNDEFKPSPIENRITQIENFNSICHYSNVESHKLTPIDFKFISENEAYNELIQLFEFYSIILSIIYILDISTLNDNQLDFKINGYKTIKGSTDLKSTNIINTREYYDIFNWVYYGGNLNDKIGLARNIISLHFITDGDFGLLGNPFLSIQSSYKVYEKQNIKQYIEIRNKISDQLFDFNNRANKIVDSFAGGFQKSALALLSFYVSAIVIRVLSKGDFVNIFTFDATILSLVFIFCSFIYFLVSRWEVNVQRQRFVNSYLNLKQRNTDLLDENDINRILNCDKEFDEDLSFIDDKRKIYSQMWLSFLFLLAGITLYLFLKYNLALLFDTALFKLLFAKAGNC